MGETPQRSIIIYGKGGVGKTAVAANLAVGLERLGQRVMLVGCSPNGSVADPYGRDDLAPSLMDVYRVEGLSAGSVAQALWKTPHGAVAADAGAPVPGIGCAATVMNTALYGLQRYSRGIPDLEARGYTIYDIIGDVACGGFAAPMRGPGPTEVAIVTTAEVASLYAANTIVQALAGLLPSRGAELRLRGLIAVSRGLPREEEIIAAFATRVGTRVLASIPRDPCLLRAAESAGLPVAVFAPGSEVAGVFCQLAEEVHRETAPVADPTPLAQYGELLELVQAASARPVAHDGNGAAYRERLPTVLHRRARAKRVCLYGASGVGKSTVAANLVAGLGLLGEKALLVGCDQKADSVLSLFGELKPTVLNEKTRRGLVAMPPSLLRHLIFEAPAYGGRVLAMECGAPPPGRGCAGNGVDVTLRDMEEYRLVEELDLSFVTYDVQGDVVCGGFATPLRYTEHVYIVTSGETTALATAMRIAQSVEAMRRRGLGVGLAGVIHTARDLDRESDVVDEMFDAIGLPVVRTIPYLPRLAQAGPRASTLVLEDPDSLEARIFLDLAAEVQMNEQTYPLTRAALTRAELRAIARRHQGGTDAPGRYVA